MAKTENASALGAAILGALAAGKENGGYDDVKEAASRIAGVSELNECMKRFKEMRGGGDLG